ncbi:MAG: sigma-70 family RNA polymerase sigma factor [Actinobacteria bacterium]|nr:sigma-70 family RNA polymerase sigma factor [Actinomycetota bacterium]
MKRDQLAVSAARSASRPQTNGSAVEPLLAEHGAAILSVARRNSRSAADAEDAFQRAFEKLIAKAPSLTGDELLAWMLTVVRNEALMIVRSQNRLAAEAVEEHLAYTADESPTPAELVADRETVLHGQDALRRLRPDQLRCLLLRAEGLNYAAIQSATGFSYAKVNRCLSEGRSALREGYQRISSGAECRRLQNSLSLMADGMLESSLRREVKGHLRGCVACRATLREYRLAPNRVAVAMPLAILSSGAAGGTGSRFASAARQAAENIQTACSSLLDRIGGIATIHQGLETAAVKKAVAVAAVSASLVAGGVAAEHAVDLPEPAGETNQIGATGIVGHELKTDLRETGGSGLSDLAADASVGVDIPREPRASDLIGEGAMVQIPADAEPGSVLRGDSVDGPEAFAAPLSGDAGSDGSSDRSGELAP